MDHIQEVARIEFQDFTGQESTFIITVDSANGGYQILEDLGTTTTMEKALDRVSKVARYRMAWDK